MKKIFTLFFAIVFIAVASQNSAIASAKSGMRTPQITTQPSVSPNPAHDYIMVKWEQNQCDNVLVQLYYAKGNLARTFNNKQYCDGFYSEAYKLAGLNRGGYILRIQIGTQKWSYKVLIY